MGLEVAYLEEGGLEERIMLSSDTWKGMSRVWKFMS